MVTLNTILFTTGLILSMFLATHGADKYTDENRPYEFGFNIEGEQHRHEKKDEKGLIMGEFGFITADGVYHVTVYATDEQGRFKILSMKNIRVKPYPAYNKQQKGSARQGQSLEVAAPQQTLSQETGPQNPKITIEQPARSCSSCSLPTTTTPSPPPAIRQPNVQNTHFANSNFGQNPDGANPQYPQANLSPNQQNNFNNPQTYNQQSPGVSQNKFAPHTLPEKELVAPKEDLPLYPPIDKPQNYPQGQFSLAAVSNGPAQPAVPSNLGQYPGTPQAFRPDVQSKQNVNSVARTAKKLDDVPQQTYNSVGAQPNKDVSDQGQALPKKPTLISAQMQIVDKNTDIYQRGPGEKEGLPDGLTKNDMSDLLYTFNYTVGFHGHFEEGYRNGVKQGYYYVTGRNGVRTRVDYVADEKGFRPKITQEVLELLSEDVPKPETEKDEQYGLKGYEFKWLYFPLDSKRR